MTPQFYAYIGYLAAIAIESFAYARILTPRYGRIKTPFLQTAAAAIILLLAWPVLLISLWRAAAVLPVLFLSVILLYRDRIARKLGLFVLICVLELAADMACWPLLLRCADTRDMAEVNSYGTSPQSLFVRCCYLGILFFLIVCLITFWSRREKVSVQGRDDIILPAAAALILVQIIFIGLMTFAATTQADTSLFGVMLPLTFGSFLMLCLFLGRFATYISGKAKASVETSRQALLGRHEEEMRAYADSVSRIRSQLTNAVEEAELALRTGNLDLLDALAGRPDLVIEGFPHQYSHDLAVNSLLLAKQGQAEAHHIEFSCTGAIDAGPLEAFQLCAVLSNLLDNAIRAAARCTGERWIRLCRFEKAGLWGLVCENTVPAGDTRRLRTGDHGLGLSIVRTITQSKDGTMDIRKNQHVFAIILSFLQP